MSKLEVAYLLNQYPMVSHTFIRREIVELERTGVSVHRLSIRGWRGIVADRADGVERDRTFYLMQGGFRVLLLALLDCALRRPGRLATTIRAAWQFWFYGSRGIVRTVATVLQACLAAKRLEPSNVTHLHAHFGTNSAELALYTSLLLARPYSFTVHGPGEFDDPNGFRLGAKVAAARFVVAITQYCASQISRWAQVDDWPKIQIVHCGIEMLSGPASRWPKDKFVSIARLSADKGHAIMLKAFKQALATRPTLTLDIVGDGELRGYLEQFACHLGIEKHVRFLGWRDEAGVRSAITNARALVLTSFAEGLPIVIMEAFQCGRPVLATNVAAVSELVQSGVSGWLFSPGSVDAAAAAMIECAQATDTDLELRAARGATLVRERHDIALTAASMKALFASGGTA